MCWLLFFSSEFDFVVFNINVFVKLYFIIILFKCFTYHNKYTFVG